MRTILPPICRQDHRPLVQACVRPLMVDSTRMPAWWEKLQPSKSMWNRSEETAI